MANWTRNQIQLDKQRIKAELDSLNTTPKKRLRLALQKVMENDEDQGQEALLSRYIYAMSALVHHQQRGGLKTKQVSAVYDIALGILDSQNLNPVKSKVRFLYAELYNIRSLIFRKSGAHWESAWELELSRRHDDEDSKESQNRQTLGTGIRQLRLGHCANAIHTFNEIKIDSLPVNEFFRSQIALVLAHRLRGEFSESEKILETTKNLPGLGERELLDLAWEEMSIEWQQSQDVSLMLPAVAAGGSHYKAEYFLEAYLWSSIFPTNRWRKEIALVRSMARSRSLNAHKSVALYRCAIALENCYDTEIPFERRLTALGKALAKRHQLANIDQELLMLLASVIWLRRNLAYSMADLCLNQYKILCLAMTDGKNADIFNFEALLDVVQDVKAAG